MSLTMLQIRLKLGFQRNWMAMEEVNDVWQVPKDGFDKSAFKFSNCNNERRMARIKQLYVPVVVIIILIILPKYLIIVKRNVLCTHVPLPYRMRNEWIAKYGQPLTIAECLEHYRTGNNHKKLKP
uniref:Uncharacterized protein n=1 Tax=Glossina austeni TaxID=7395 RepID=A0A1A9VXU0_GLOAU